MEMRQEASCERRREGTTPKLRNVGAWLKPGCPPGQGHTSPGDAKRAPRPRFYSGELCTQPQVGSVCTLDSPRGARPTSCFPGGASQCSSTGASGTAAPVTAARPRGRGQTPSSGRTRCAATRSGTSGRQPWLKRWDGGSYGSGSARCATTPWKLSADCCGDAREGPRHCPHLVMESAQPRQPIHRALWVDPRGCALPKERSMP